MHEEMKKLTLSSDNRSIESFYRKLELIKQVLTNSTRKYKNIQLNLVGLEGTISTELKSILKIRDRKWKKVDLSWACFKSPSDLIELFECIDQTVEDLKLEKISTNMKIEIENCACTFPKLKFLAVHDFYDELSMYPKIFANCIALKELELKYEANPGNDYSGDDNALETRKMLNCHKHLKKLTTKFGTHFGLSEYLNIDISEGLQCQLTSLSLCCRKLNANQTTNLQKLLRSQLTSLKSLSFEGWVGLEAAKMIFHHIPSLTYLKLDDFVRKDTTIEFSKPLKFHHTTTITDLKAAKFHRNTTITDFHLKVKHDEVDMLRVFFPLVPNLKHLTVSFVNDEILDVIAANFPDLETLSTHNFYVRDVSKDILKNLKKLSSRPGTKETARSGHIRKSTSSSFHFAKKVDDMNEECLQKYLDEYTYTSGMRKVLRRDLIQEQKTHESEWKLFRETRRMKLRW